MHHKLIIPGMWCVTIQFISGMQIMKYCINYLRSNVEMVSWQNLL